MPPATSSSHMFTLLLTCLPYIGGETWRSLEDHITWRSFFGPFHSVKVLKVQCKLVNSVATSLIPCEEQDYERLPALEEIELRSERVYLSGSARQKQRASATRVLKRLVASRSKTGRSVNVSWKEACDTTWNDKCFV
jgi:hypothetical protein